VRYIYALHDHNVTLKKLGTLVVSGLSRAQELNRDGYGIFSTVNEFETETRRKEGITRLNSVFIDLDGGDKVSQMIAVTNAPLNPSMMVETKNGFHVYWDISSDLVMEMGREEAIGEYERFLRKNLIPAFGSDTNAADASRIMRVPTFKHVKDPTQPFEVKVFFENNKQYSWFELLDAWPRLLLDEPVTEHVAEEVSGDSFWDRAGSLNCEYALTKLSGSRAVSGETYTFTDTQRGNKNISVDGKMSSCWVDANG